MHGLHVAQPMPLYLSSSRATIYLSMASVRRKQGLGILLYVPITMQSPLPRFPHTLFVRVPLDIDGLYVVQPRRASTSHSNEYPRQVLVLYASHGPSRIVWLQD